MELSGDVRLLERGRRGVTLTEAGEALAHHARLICRQMAMWRGELGEYAKGLRSTLRVTNTLPWPNPWPNCCRCGLPTGGPPIRASIST
ncbi:LysR family transcriptional regulator [Paracoccus sp. MKU1]|uniref:LysR family transcriptional regulator n=1 Tax=Paracoccus sp. MKU1 TaxID=1745182 RepID=UPI000AD9C9C7|nr:LysR family transcriptional regulator [Paracoccus sp. MKU1]